MRTVTIRGHRPGRPSGDAPTLVSQFRSASFYNNGEIHWVSREIPKAFHRVWNQGLPSKLPTFGFSPSTVSRTAGEPSPPEFTGSRSSHFLQMLIILTVQYLRPPSFCHSVMFFCFLPQTQSIILPIAPLLLSILTALPVKQTSMLVGTVESPLYFKTPVVITSPWSTNNHACKTSSISISLEDHSFSHICPLDRLFWVPHTQFLFFPYPLIRHYVALHIRACITCCMQIWFSVLRQMFLFFQLNVRTLSTLKYYSHL